MFGVTVKRSAFVGETVEQQNQHQAAAGAGPAKRTLQPMVTGTSVLGVKVRERGQGVDGWGRRLFDRSVDTIPTLNHFPDHNTINSIKAA